MTRLERRLVRLRIRSGCKTLFERVSRKNDCLVSPRVACIVSRRVRVYPRMPGLHLYIIGLHCTRREYILGRFDGLQGTQISMNVEGGVEE